MTTLAPQPNTATPPRPVTDPAKARRKGIILTIAAIILAIAGGIAVTLYVGRLEAEVGVREMVVVASEPIAARQQITEDMLTTVELPVKYLAPSYILNVNDLVDGNTTALINIAPGEYVQQNMVSRNAGLEPGSRAVSIPVNGITSVGNSVRQGNYVDIVLSYVGRDGV
ncbi:MAG: RcpC/CpaB family pilus assembly protein, partial [Chloroflexota bacterium]